MSTDEIAVRRCPGPCRQFLEVDAEGRFPVHACVAEPPPGTVVQWTCQFGPHGRPYTFVALRVDGLGWFLTGQWTSPVTWAEVLSLTAGAPVYAAQTWVPLLAAQRDPHRQ